MRPKANDSMAQSKEAAEKAKTESLRNQVIKFDVLPVNVEEKGFDLEKKLRDTKCNMILPVQGIVRGIMFINGTSTAGKSTLIINMILRKELFGCFDRWYFVTPVADKDKKLMAVAETHEDKVLIFKEFTESLLLNVERENDQAEFDNENRAVGLVLEDSTSATKASRTMMNSTGPILRHKVPLTIIVGHTYRMIADKRLRNNLTAIIIMKKSTLDDAMAILKEVSADLKADPETLASLYLKYMGPDSDPEDEYAFMLINKRTGQIWYKFNYLIYDSKDPTLHSSVRVSRNITQSRADGYTADPNPSKKSKRK